MRATDPRVVLQAAAGPRDVIQAASGAASEVAAMRAVGSRDVLAETAATHAADPGDAMQTMSDGAAMRAAGLHVAAQAVDAAAPAHAFVPHVAAPVANEPAEHEEDPELESESEFEPEPALESSTEATADLPTLDPAAIAHFVAIQGALTFREGMLARALAAELSPSEMRAWLAELRRLSVPDAVAKIREVLGADDSGNTGGVS